MSDLSTAEWPHWNALTPTFKSSFSSINEEAYEAARQVWPNALHFAQHQGLDASDALEPFLKVVESVSSQSIAATALEKMLLPGNHDRYIYTAKGFLYAPGGDQFETTLKNHWVGPVRTYPILRNGDGLSVVIIAADFSLQSKTDCTLPFLRLSRLAQGRVYPTILEKLVSATKDAKEKERSKGYTPVILWAVHFPPFFVHRKSSRVTQALTNLTKNLIDEKLLVEKAKENNIYAILAGHTHEAQDYEEPNSSRIVTAPASDLSPHRSKRLARPGSC